MKNWFKKLTQTIQKFFKNWITKHGFVNIGWVIAFILLWWSFGMKILAGVCAGIFIEKNRRQFILAWKEIKSKF